MYLGVVFHCITENGEFQFKLMGSESPSEDTTVR